MVDSVNCRKRRSRCEYWDRKFAARCGEAIGKAARRRVSAWDRGDPGGVVMETSGSVMSAPVILTVCTGNVCRSPYLQRLLQTGLDDSWGVGAVRVTSAGTRALVGRPLDRNASKLLGTVDGDRWAHSARQVTREAVAEASLVITANRDQRGVVAQLHPRALKTTHSLRDLAQLADHLTLPSVPDPYLPDPTQWFSTVIPLLAADRGKRPPLPADQADIHDPYGRAPEAFRRMAEQIRPCVPAVLRVLGRPAS